LYAPIALLCAASESTRATPERTWRAGPVMTTPRKTVKRLQAGLAGISLAGALGASAPGWQLVWADEFDGNALDLQRWEWEVNARGGGNNELQYYTDRPENTRVEGGLLTLTARKETFTGPEGTREYTSARIRTKGKGDWKYGRIEVRARMPVGQGIWPAIWMMPTHDTYGGWAGSGEIDIMEYLGQ